MALSETLLATVITGGVGIVGILVSRFKCIVQFEGCCKLKSCRFGLLDNSIVDDHEVSLKKIECNGTDLIYKSKNFINIDSDDDTEHHV